MKKIVLKLDLHDDKDKQRAIKAVSTLRGVDSIAMDMKERKMTVVGTVDPVNVASKLRKLWHATIVSIGPAKEEKKEEPKKEEPKKEEAKEEKKEEAKKEEKKEEPKKEEEKKEEKKEEGKEEKKEEAKKEEKKEEPKKEENPPQHMVAAEPPNALKAYYYYNPPPVAYNPPPVAYNPPMVTHHYYVPSAEENPNSCSIL